MKSKPLVPTLLALALAGLGMLLAPHQLLGKKGAPPAASGSYSIFAEPMAAMTWPEVEAAAMSGAIVLTKTAAIEEHGPHMTCAIDACGGHLLCRLIRRELEARGVPDVEYLDLHAGAWESGLAAAFFPGEINEKAARGLAPTQVTMAGIGEWVKDMKSVTPLGYLGNPAGFDARAAKASTEADCRLAADAIAKSLAPEKRPLGSGAGAKTTDRANWGENR